jgi:hypothetical protein
VTIILTTTRLEHEMTRKANSLILKFIIIWRVENECVSYYYHLAGKRDEKKRRCHASGLVEKLTQGTTLQECYATMANIPHFDWWTICDQKESMCSKSPQKKKKNQLVDYLVSTNPRRVSLETEELPFVLKTFFFKEKKNQIYCFL